MARTKKFHGTTKYELEGARGLNLAEMVLVGSPNSGKYPQRRPLVLSLEEHAVFCYGTLGTELDRTIELLAMRPKERARRLKILRTIRAKISHL